MSCDSAIQMLGKLGELEAVGRNIPRRIPVLACRLIRDVQPSHQGGFVEWARFPLLRGELAVVFVSMYRSLQCP